MKKLKSNNIFLLSLVLVFITLVAYFLTKPVSLLTFRVSPNKLTLKSGELVTAEVTLSGPESLLKNVSVMDIEIEYEEDELEILSASPGSFFTDPLIVKNDIENGFFSIAVNPAGERETTLNSQKEGEILKLVFLAKEGVKNTKISFDETTSIYVSKLGRVKWLEKR